MSEYDAVPDAPVSRRKRTVAGSFSFGLGETLAHAFRFYGRHILMLLVFALAAYAPAAAWQLAAVERVWDAPPSAFLREVPGLGVVQFDFWDVVGSETGFVGQILGLITPMLLQAIVAVAVFQYLGGGRVRYGRSVAEGLTRLLSVFGVALLSAFIVVVVLFVAGFLMVPFIRGGVGAVIVIAVLTMMVMSVIYCVFFVAVPATVVERIGPAQAMSRSAALTSGARWKIFAIVLVSVGLGVAVAMGVRAAIGDFPASLAAARVGIIVSTAATAMFAAFAAVCAAVAYHQLRQAKEGVGIDQLVQVFE